MIGRLKGIIWEKGEDGKIILDVNGVGYNVLLPLSSLMQLGDIGGETTLYIHTHVREDAMSLFGFITEAERVLFLMLLSVSGIGGKQAMNILSGLQLKDIIAAIRASDAKPLTQISGVGKKTAEMVVVTLHDKILKHPVLADIHISDPGIATGGASRKVFDVKSALEELGFRPVEIEAALKSISNDDIEKLDFDGLTRRALKSLYKKTR